MKFNKTIGVYDNVITDIQCEDLINIFHSAENDGAINIGAMAGGVDKAVKDTTDYDLQLNSSFDGSRLNELITDVFNDVLNNKYFNDWGFEADYYHRRIVDDKTYWPCFNIQKYVKNEGHYNAFHLESEDINSCSRVFVFILYLNDVNEGGETTFLFKEDGEDDFFKVKPKAGRLVIHPAGWPFIHKGEMPLSDDKYILTTWLTYKNE
tara:strand:+ start:164 stop:787 length:624 start_codon:yes stop_codon:yes gene_type:complete